MKHMKKLNGFRGGIGPLCWIDTCGSDSCSGENCWIYDSCTDDYSPPCKFIDRCGMD